MPIPDKNALPLYGCITGIMIPEPHVQLIEGITLTQGYFEVFSTPMLAFKEAAPGTHTPGPWVAVRGNFNSYYSRAELAVESLSSLDGFSPSQAAWLVAALLRLRAESPVRIAAIANMPLLGIPGQRDTWALAFESSAHQTGIFRTQYTELTAEDIAWLSAALPVAARFYHDDRFMRAFTVFDESLWSGRVEVGTILLWTAIEILFDLSGEPHKTKAISAALSEHVAADARDRDRAYNVIRELYEKRGRTVHSGRSIEERDYAQSFALARAAFVNCIERRQLPKGRTRTFQ
jgi:hypothetical protein